MVIDIIVLAVLLISALISFIRGFIRETLTILGVVGGLAAAYFGGPALSPFMKDWLGVVDGEKPKMLMGVLPYPILADVLSYGLIFIVVVLMLSVVSHILAETVRKIGLGAIDRTLGVVFGLARGLLLLAVLYLPIHLSADDATKKEWFEGSRTSVWLETMSAQLALLLPEDAVKKIEDSTKKAAEAAEGEEALTTKPLDALKQEEENKEAAEEGTPAPEEDGNGYDDQFRDEMDRMFENDGAPPQPAPAPMDSVPPEQQPAPEQEEEVTP